MTSIYQPITGRPIDALVQSHTFPEDQLALLFEDENQNFSTAKDLAP